MTLTMPKTLLLLLLLAFCAAPLAAQEAPEKIRVLYVTGQNNHDWPFTSKHWISVLELTERFAVTRTEDPAKDLAELDLAAFDLIFLDYNGARWGEKAEERFRKAVEGGVGVFVLHAANNAFPGWKDYEQMVCLCFRERAGHGDFHAFDVDVVDRNHPVTRDLPPMRAHVDELYHRLDRISGAKFRVLMTAQSDPATGGTGDEEPMVLVGQYGKGRVFHTTLGHVWPGRESDRVSVMDPQLQLLVCRGSEWAATGDCRIACERFGLAAFETEAQRPRSPWVLRCVLDGRARMIVIGLDAMINVAWDATHCEPYLVWAGGLKLQGAVFDAVHGPQPMNQGLPFWRNEDIAKSPVVVGVEGRRFRFLGYRFDDEGSIVLRYRPADLEDALVEETLEHLGRGSPSLIRTVTISGLPEGRTLRIKSLVGNHHYELGNETRTMISNFRITKEVE